MNLFEPSSIVSVDDAANDDTNEAESTVRLVSVFERLHNKLKGWLEREFGGGPPYPEDVVQQTFAKLAARGDLSEVRNLEAYAWTTAINQVREEKRAQIVADSYANDRRNGVWGTEVDEFDPERVMRARQELEIIAETLENMSERRRSIFMACRFEGLSQEEAGKRAGVSKSAAVRHIAIATEMIVAALCDGDPSSNNSNAK